MARRIRIVVGEGRTAQRGLLRFVLEGEGFDVVGEASGSADLSGVIDQQRPDVVVLDDGIGVMAVSMVHEVAPDTKIVLVWPAAVVPIGGDARVEPGKILKDLGPAVQHVAAATLGLTETFQRPEWIDRVRKDPATLREKLGGKETTTRPSVTRLQRGGRRLRPIPRRSKTIGQERREEPIPAPIVVLPGGDGGGELEPVLDIGGAGAAGTGAAEEPVQERSEWNRRLGTLALSGAAAVSALVLALALGGGRIPVNVVRGGGTLPPGATEFDRPGSSFQGPFGAGSPGGSGFDPIPVVEEPAGGPDQGGGGPVIGGTGGGLVVGGGIGGDLARPDTSGGSDGPATGGGPDGGTGTGGGGNGGGGTGGGGTGGGGTGGGGNGGG
ncbi:MAG: hypothetical protein ACR2L4_02185, partial [Actinomycetota bacterium]